MNTETESCSQEFSTLAKPSEEWKQVADQYFDTFELKRKEAIYYYVDTGYHAINRYLRQCDKLDQERDIFIQEAIQSAIPTEKDIRTFRRTKFVAKLLIS